MRRLPIREAKRPPEGISVQNPLNPDGAEAPFEPARGVFTGRAVTTIGREPGKECSTNQGQIAAV